MDDLLARHEVAKRLKCSIRHVDRMIREEGLPVVRIGRRVLVPTDELDKWLRRRLTSSGTSPTQD